MRPLSKKESTYADVRALVQQRANDLGLDHGLEWTGNNWHWFCLPRRENRYGHELRCEVVHPEDLESCAAGHGPKGT